VPVAQAFEDLILAPAAVHDKGLDQSARLIDTAAMAGKISVLGPRQQRLQRAYIVTHIAFGRRDDSCIPAHHMIAR
jgi:hypothetical protein